MCLAVPGKITSVKSNNAEVDFNGVKRAVSLDLVPEARKNDYVLVHAGFAIQVLSPEEAQETLRLFAEIYGKEHQDAASGPLSHLKP
ncbi:MAG: HypC/HybG/HupF family hydrogenase formation chaperone [Elusimicrobiales bacterium]|nr:HypC/HybG/HupF family hydrogenase formation chaperone [Elusimicrobiales bacterium]